MGINNENGIEGNNNKQLIGSVQQMSKKNSYRLFAKKKDFMKIKQFQQEMIMLTLLLKMMKKFIIQIMVY